MNTSAVLQRMPHSNACTAFDLDNIPDRDGLLMPMSRARKSPMTKTLVSVTASMTTNGTTAFHQRHGKPGSAANGSTVTTGGGGGDVRGSAFVDGVTGDCWSSVVISSDVSLQTRRVLIVCQRQRATRRT